MRRSGELRADAAGVVFDGMRVPRSEITRGSMWPHPCLEIALATGEVERFSFGRWDDASRDSAAEHIRQAMRAYRTGASADDAALVRRGKRDVPTWIDHLRSIGTGANAGPRTAAVSPERLWRLVEDASGAPVDRAAAAIAIRASADEISRGRLRVAAAASAAPKLRIALEAIADEDDEALATALTNLEPRAKPER